MLLQYKLPSRQLALEYLQQQLFTIHGVQARYSRSVKWEVASHLMDGVGRDNINFRCRCSLTSMLLGHVPDAAVAECTFFLAVSSPPLVPSSSSWDVILIAGVPRPGTEYGKVAPQPAPPTAEVVVAGPPPQPPQPQPQPPPPAAMAAADRYMSPEPLAAARSSCIIGAAAVRRRGTGHGSRYSRSVKWEVASHLMDGVGRDNINL
ncbi:hypothetical protein VOLCADRAFT_96419 [Volvox carteri f. nagariensis]|uniref:Uncharacterized protein n=1 Tax=Volvox carteri f. nagariensis TaxID=3068 RepID=D8UA22_VOLCA|nr:uncharacterized protein VOLCADRAFT_96419 [Volvox carteri f. nagariensis]EFJ43397.1 hypothetical protein VOLCADRAFT_96419 [Volvox carteri f. nagariensis]|eukprot:XP_002955544.1 hypothetical protein VOLCADRAFT_96419 [Volvox carteri f. nagariensis]